jgi:aldehyde dehydrogenase (NAD+)
MGGKNIIIVMEDANLELAVDGAVWGGFGTSGQRCTAASRVGVHKSVYKEFVERFVSRVKTLRVGDGLDPDTDMGPCINEQQLKTVMNYVEIGKDEGGKLLAGGNRLDRGRYAKGWFHAPTVFGDCSPEMRIAQEEIFGPVVSVIPVESLEQAIDVASRRHAIFTPASSTSMRRRSARKLTSPSAEPSRRATATAKPPLPPLTSSPNGRRSTSITRTSSSALKSTTPSCPGRVGCGSLTKSW